ncbi:MAG: flippase [Candidatus Binatia bacterium]|nr:flippase [Candidatus Binatia bacterium]
MSIRPFAKGGALGLATLLVEKASALVLVVALARTLSPDDYGLYSFVIAYLTLFQVLADLGLETILLRRLSQEPENRSRLMANALGMRVLLAMLSAAIAVALTPVAAPGQPDVRPLVAIGAAGLLFAAQPGFRALLRSELRLDAVLSVAVVTNVILFALVGLALWTGAGLRGVFVGIASAHLAGFAFAGFVVRKSFRFRLRCERPVWESLAREAWPVGANFFVIMLGLRVAPLLLMTYGGPIEVGYLASAMRLTEAMNLVADGLMMVVFPMLARLATTNEGGLHDLAQVSAKVLAAVLLMAVLALSELAPDVLGLLFGEEFRAAGPALVVLSWSALLAALGTLYTNMLVALGRQRVLFALNAVSAVFQVGLQLFLVSHYGLLGAAVGVVLASFVNHLALCLLPATAPWVRPAVRAVLPLWGLAVALLVAAGLVPAPALAKAVGLVASFALLSVVLGGLGRSDIDQLRRALATD